MKFLLAIFTIAISGGLIPPDLVPSKGCELWKGSVKGNDPSVSVQLTLCEKDGGLTGELQWSSGMSGWNRRRVVGKYESPKKDKLTLRDIEFIENNPKWPYIFCLIDEYQLVKQGNSMVGSYYSAKCRDVATVRLKRQSSK